MTGAARIAGTGIITALGQDAAACLAALLTEQSGIGPARFLQSRWTAEIPVGEVPFSNEALARMAGVSPHWPRTALLSAVAVREAWGPLAERAAGLRTGFLSANTVGGMDLTENFYGDYKSGVDTGSDALFRNHECGAVTGLVARHFGFTHFITTVSTACSSSANSIAMAASMLRAGMLDIAVAGGADALSRFTLNGFNSLGILDRQACQPFDGARRGLNLGEGAGYLVLMNEKALEQCGIEDAPFAVTGWGNANDAHHQTASSPEGTGNKLAMQAALRRAGLSSQHISYINLHGTGTQNNDSSEGRAIEAVFGKDVPPASSTKSYTGHTLGAAGGVEAVFSVMALREDAVFPNLRWSTPMEDVSFRPVTSLSRGAVLSHILSNSFGFGGACSSLIFSRL